MRYKRGFQREDGMIFWAYNKARKNPEIWLNKNDFIRSNLLKIQWQRNNLDNEKNRKNVQNWYLKNKSKKLASVRKYQMQKRCVKTLDSKIISVFYEAAKRVGKCIGIKFHVDHIIPISKGGIHAPSNLQWVPYKWNISKHNRQIGKLFAV
jgi:hypothetical protein